MVVKIRKKGNTVFYSEDIESISFGDSTLTLRCSGQTKIFFRVEYDEIKIEDKQ
ncbi:MAG: hypothetical protein IJR66_02350 [Clostridia bacterium]|nr:hypothetical protein [Clostridia bacterium]